MAGFETGLLHVGQRMWFAGRVSSGSSGMSCSAFRRALALLSRSSEASESADEREEVEPDRFLEWSGLSCRSSPSGRSRPRACAAGWGLGVGIMIFALFPDALESGVAGVKSGTSRSFASVLFSGDRGDEGSRNEFLFLSPYFRFLRDWLD